MSTVDAHGNEALLCIRCHAAPAATCAGCGSQSTICADCLDADIDLEGEIAVGPNPHTEEHELVLWECPECCTDAEPDAGSNLDNLGNLLADMSTIARTHPHANREEKHVLLKELQATQKMARQRGGS